MQYFIVYIADKDKYHITYNRSLKKKWYKCSRVTDFENKFKITKGKGEGRDELGVWS